MLGELATPKFILLYLFLASAFYVHFRGKERHTFTRQLTDHSTFLAPYNALMYLFSAVPTKPRVDTGLFPDLGRLRENWRTIRDEARRVYEAGHARGSPKYDDLAFNSFFRTGWSRFYLKWYDDYLPSARELCPKTCALLEDMPGINAALFAVLAPHSHLVRHRDPFGGSLRYHLGLITPNSDDCHIFIDGEPYSWRDGEDVLFDETYMHRARNDTDQARVILFCDVHRPLRFKPIAALNHFIVRHVAKATTTRNFEGEKLGWMNKAFGYLYHLRIVGKKLKSRSKVAYYSVKYAVLGSVAYMVFFA